VVLTTDQRLQFATIQKQPKRRESFLIVIPDLIRKLGSTLLVKVFHKKQENSLTA